MKDYKERFQGIQDRMRSIETADLQAGGRQKVGSNMPTLPDLLRTILDKSEPGYMFRDIMILIRQQGYDGPESRIRAALLRLTETGFLMRSGNHYFRVKGGQ